MKDYILAKLKEIPWFRERKNRRQGFALHLHRKYKLPEEVSIGTLIEILSDGESMDRTWRWTLQQEENKDLRGSDWADGKKLSQKWQIEEGEYEPHYQSDIKINEKI